jgi:hypothetical protein
MVRVAIAWAMFLLLLPTAWLTTAIPKESPSQPNKKAEIKPPLLNFYPSLGNSERLA